MTAPTHRVYFKTLTYKVRIATPEFRYVDYLCNSPIQLDNFLLWQVATPTFRLILICEGPVREIPQRYSLFPSELSGLWVSLVFLLKIYKI